MLYDISQPIFDGTHVDAPFHFLRDGKGINEIALEKFMGKSCIISCAGDVTAEDAERILIIAAEAANGAEKHILIKGEATVTLEAALPAQGVVGKI